MKRVEVNDSESIYVLANYYFQGLNDIQQDQTKAIELFSRAANLGLGKAHWNLADIYYKGGDL
jgi:TPR repeat protein